MPIRPSYSESNIVGYSGNEPPSPSPSSSEQNAVENVTVYVEEEEAPVQRDDDHLEAPTTWNIEEAEAAPTDDMGCNKEEVKPSAVKLLEHASYLFHKDRTEQLRRTINLLPRGREFVVFNVFGDLARAFGYGRRKRHKRVEFPEDVLEHYNQKGDVAGKDRFVPSTKQPYKGVSATTKKRKLSAVYSSWTVKASEFVPRVERIDDYTKTEYFCEKNCIGCECCWCDCCKSSKKPPLTVVMEGYLNDLNLASFFLHSHATRTFESAMGALEFVRLHTFSLTTMAPKTWTTGYSQQHMGMMTASIWIFGYCIRTILEMACHESCNMLPSEVGFRKVMESFAALCLSISESTKIVLQYSHNFYNFGKECIRILKILEIVVGFKTEFNLRKPLRRGDGLELNHELKKKDVEKQRAVTVMVAKTTSIFDNDDAPLEWKSFQEMSGNEKVYCLRHLINTSSDGIGLVQTQLRFLLDDIVDSVKDIAEADLLFLLADMYDRVKFLLNVGKKTTKTEFEEIASLMTDFCKDFQSFLDYGQHIIKRFIEFRDMVHLTHDYLVNGLNLEMLAEMLPANIFKRKRRNPCCVTSTKKKKDIKNKYFPKYKVMDFFKVYYRDAVHGQIYANKYQFCLGWDTNYIEDIVPRSMQYKWGETDNTTPRISFEEYVDPDQIEEEVNVEVIKPILVGSGSASSDDHVIEAPTNREGGETGPAGDVPNTDSNPKTTNPNPTPKGANPNTNPTP